MRIANVTVLSLVLAFAANAGNPVKDAEKQAVEDIYSGNYKFLSWYDGWGRHDVWGVGIIEASYSTGRIECDGTTFPLSPVWDTHLIVTDPRPDQTREYVEAYNSVVLEALELMAVGCTLDWNWDK